MDESILLTVMKGIGIDPSYQVFDPILLVHINAAVSILCQLGIGHNGFCVVDEDDTWADMLEDTTKFAIAKSYMILKVGMLFDPPQNGVLKDARVTSLNELEWRLSITN